MAEEYLKPEGNGKAAETTMWCCSDQITPVAVSKQYSMLHWQLELPQKPGKKGNSLGAQKVNPGKELLVLLIYLTRNRDRAADPKQVVQEHGGFHSTDPLTKAALNIILYGKARLWDWTMYVLNWKGTHFLFSALH